LRGPDLAEHRVDEDAILLGVLVGLHEGERDLAPRHPADRRIERVQVIAARAAAAGAWRLGAPLAAGEHRRLLVVVNRAAAGAALVDGALRRQQQLRPDQAAELERLHLPARRTRHVVAPLVVDA
jgi:hypothetical protein